MFLHFSTQKIATSQLRNGSATLYLLVEMLTNWSIVGTEQKSNHKFRFCIQFYIFLIYWLCLVVDVLGIVFWENESNVFVFWDVIILL